MTDKPPLNEGEPSESAPPARARANTISSLLTASHLLTGAPDEETLANAFAEVMLSFDVDYYSLSSYHEVPERYVKVLSMWDRRGRAPMRPGDIFPMRTASIFDLITPDEPFIVEDYVPGKLKRDSPLLQAFTSKIGARALSIYPLAEGNKLIGYLSIFYSEPHPQTEEEVQVLSLLAQLTSVALVNLKIRAELAKKVSQLHELYRMGEVLGEISDEDALFDAAAALLASEIHYQDCWLGLIDKEAGLLRQKSHAGVLANPAAPKKTVSLTERGVRAIDALSAAHPVGHSGLQEAAEAEGWGAVAKSKGINSGIYVPLRAEGEVFGLMVVLSSDARTSDDEIALLGSFGNQLASAIGRLRMNKERAQKVAELEAAYANHARLLETVRELSTPVIPVHDGVLVLPLVGMMDSSRSALLMEALLDGVQRERARVVILDVTGVPTVDTGVANHLMRSARGASLLGAKCVLVGVSPAVAQTMVGLGVDLEEIVTRRNLQAGILYALELLERGAH